MPGVLSWLPQVYSPVTCFLSFPQPLVCLPLMFNSQQSIRQDDTSPSSPAIWAFICYTNSFVCWLSVCCLIQRQNKQKAQILLLLLLPRLIWTLPVLLPQGSIPLQQACQIRLTHETHWSVSGENAQGGGWWHLHRGFPRGGERKRERETQSETFVFWETFIVIFERRMLRFFLTGKETNARGPQLLWLPRYP